MSKTGAQLLTGLSVFLDDNYPSTTTSAGATDKDTIVDTALEIYGDNRLVGWYIRITEGSASWEIARITGNAQATGTVTVAPPFTVQIGSGIDYELHQFNPKAKFAALDSARLQVSSDVFQLVVDETITTDGHTREYTIPTSIERGPSQVYIEAPYSPVASWNFVPEPDVTDTMAHWTASNVTLADYETTEHDLYIPKHGTIAVKASVAAAVAGTLTLPVSGMENGVTAAKAAGRLMTFAAWIYSKGGSLTLSILDDSGTVVTSAAHQGLGWELVSAEGTIAQNNSTTLSIRISETSANASTFFINDLWFYYGPYTKINGQYYSSIPLRISRDDTQKRFILNESVPARRQLRVVGKAALSSLGTTPATQVTNTMEVETGAAEILYAKAAEILFQQERITTQNMAAVSQRIGYVKDRTPEIRMNWDIDTPVQRIYGPYSRGR